MAYLRTVVTEVDKGYVLVEVPFWFFIRELRDPYPNAEGKGERFFTATRNLDYFIQGVKGAVQVVIRFQWTTEKKLEVLKVEVLTPEENPHSKESSFPYQVLDRVKHLVEETKLAIEGARKASELLYRDPAEYEDPELQQQKLLKIAQAPFGLLGDLPNQKSKEFAEVCLDLVEWLRENNYPSPTKKARELLSDSTGKPIAERTFDRRLEQARNARSRKIQSMKKAKTKGTKK